MSGSESKLETELRKCEVAVGLSTSLQQVEEALRSYRDYRNRTRWFLCGTAICAVVSMILGAGWDRGSAPNFLSWMLAMLTLSGGTLSFLLELSTMKYRDKVDKAAGTLSYPMTQPLLAEISKHNRVVTALIEADKVHRHADPDRYAEFQGKVRSVLALLGPNAVTLRDLIVEYDDYSGVRVDINRELGEALGSHGLSVNPGSVESAYVSTLDDTAATLRAAVDLYGTNLLDLNTTQPRPILKTSA